MSRYALLFIIRTSKSLSSFWFYAILSPRKGVMKMKEFVEVEGIPFFFGFFLPALVLMGLAAKVLGG